MQVEEELARLSPSKDTVLAIGVFDGVHLGHRYLLSQLMETARREGLLAGVVTFRQHPLELLSPGAEPPYLSAAADRVELLKREGVDLVVAISFTAALARLTAREFALLLQKHLRMRGLVIGPDFAMGRGREGDAGALHKLGEELGFSVTVIPPHLIGGEVTSSTAIRTALADGDMARVTRLLGRPYSLRGPVTAGAGRGTGMGFPTANIEVDPKQAIPPEGIYATWAYIGDEAYRSASPSAHQSMTNIGRRPTFGEHQRTVEVYLLNYQDNLYGRELRIDFVERLRDEKKFDTVDELKKQIAEDVEQGKAILNARGTG